VTLDNIRSEDYDNYISPFLRNGLIVDTCVLYELIDGLIKTRIGKKKLDRLSDFEQITAVFDLIHVTQQWHKLYVTPHILTEICTHLENKYNGRQDYKKIIEEVFPLLEGMSEYHVKKEDFCKQIDKDQPVIQSGDISIYVTADDFSAKKEKVAILTKDGGIKKRMKDLPYVLVMDYQAIAYNLV